MPLQLKCTLYRGPGTWLILLYIFHNRKIFRLHIGELLFSTKHDLGQMISEPEVAHFLKRHYLCEIRTKQISFSKNFIVL